MKNISKMRRIPKVPRVIFFVLLALVFLMASDSLVIAGTDVARINTVAGLDITGSIQNETSLIQNKPNDPNNIIIAHNDDTDGIGQVGPGLGISYSLDGGATWLHSHINMNGPMTFDPSVAVDTNGSVYAICINDLSPIGQPPIELYIHESTDKGATWGSSSVIRSYGSGSNWYLDKCWITVDPYSSSSYQNNIYIAWQEDDLISGTLSYIYFVKMTPADVDQGIVNTPIRITETSRSTPYYDNAPVPAVAPNGDIYVAWLDSDITNFWGRVPGTIRLRKSTNGGTSFDGPGNPGGSTAVANFTTVPKYVFGSMPYRQTSFPSIACDPTNSSNVYVVYAADPDGVIGPDDGDVYFTRSNNGGVTWTTPMVVNNDGTTKSQFQPWIDVKPNGYIDIVWLDARNDLTPFPMSNSTFDIYMAASTDGGQTFSNQRVSDNSFSVLRTGGGNHWIGEYLGLDVDSSIAYISWTGVQNDDTDIWFDTMPNPNTSTGQSVSVNVAANLTAAFSNVIIPGNTTATVTGVSVYAAPSAYAFIPGGSYYGYFDLSTTAEYSGPVDIEFKYDPAKVGPNEASLKLFHWNGLSWDDATTFVDTTNDTITGQVNTLSLFALALPADTTPPEITITSPTAYGVYPAGNVSFGFSATDESSGVKSCEATLDEGAPFASPKTSSLGAGVYNLEVTAEDYAGNISTKQIMFVVYDPTAGFVTGGGWIVPDIAVGEKATFGFVSKYLKGTTRPSGNLEFQYNYKNIHLKSTAMEWLVVSDNSAIFKGTGTINGVGGFTYIVDVTDGDRTAGKPDHFKISIWSAEEIFTEPLHRYQGDLAGGSIIVHKK